jgi:hypothetical protein
MEASMNALTRLVAVVAGLVLLIHVTPSWGQTATCSSPACNPTVSDANANTAGGTEALVSVDETGAGGNNNTATGVLALVGNTTGSSNTATGVLALVGNTTGSSNTATGVLALGDNDTGAKNTAIGSSALLSNSIGSKNTAVGSTALFLSTGNGNIALGFKAGFALASGNNNIYVGNPGASTESLTMRLGSVQTSTFIAGINTSTVSDATVMIDTATGQLGIAASSARYKQNIAPMGTQSEKLLQLHPVTFAYKDDNQGATHYGLIAEQVATVYPELVTHTASGEVQTVKYQELIPMLLNELQRQRQDLAKLQALLEQGQGSAASTCAATGQTAASTP